MGRRDRYQSPDEQRRLIAAVAASKRVTLGLEVVEEDVSGSRAAEERGLERLLVRAERDESEGLIVAFQDRLSRGSLIETSRVWERLGRAGARLLTGDGLDSAASGQELLFNVRAAIARTSGSGTATAGPGRARMVARGAHHCAQPPLGTGRARAAAWSRRRTRTGCARCSGAGWRARPTPSWPAGSA